jgi:endonuclease/exonuclease/phosphatase family metal-dependent hydrolase
MSFNALNGGTPVSHVVDAIDAARSDIVCLQELTPVLSAALDERLGDRYPHRVFEPRPDVQGIGIASRFPISDGAVLALGLNFLPAVAATIRVGSRKVHVVCVHFVPPQTGFARGGNLWEKYQRNERFRLLQVAALLEHLETVDASVLVLGDMNEWPGQAALTALAAAGFSDACRLRDSRCGPTWPGRVIYFLPALARIDYVLGRGVTFTQAAVLDAGGSDHFPVAARIRLRDQ